MAEDQVDLDAELRRINGMWQELDLSCIPLAFASAMAFHQVYGSGRGVVSRRDYDDALNLTAVALSRLIAVYTTSDPIAGRVPVQIDLRKQHFACGATELRSADGSVVRELSLNRGELLSAVSLIKRAGLPFSFALVSSLSSQSGKPAEPPRAHDER